MDINELIKALENENNEHIINNDLKNISKIKNDILQNLGLPKNQLKSLHKSLKDYKFVDELSDLQIGRCIRFIKLKNIDNIKLTNTLISCDVKIENHGIIIICKNFQHRYFQINMNEVLIFQKITDQEKIILSALKYLNT